jgi:hypothetical protein
MYTNTKRKILNCNWSTYFNNMCLGWDITSKFASLKIKSANTSAPAKRTETTNPKWNQIPIQEKQNLDKILYHVISKTPTSATACGTKLKTQTKNYKRKWKSSIILCEISSSHGGEFELNFIIIRDDGGSTYLWNVGRQLFYTAVHPRRQFWSIILLSKTWHLEEGTTTIRPLSNSKELVFLNELKTKPT